MNAHTHHLYKTFSESKTAYQHMQTIKDIHKLETFIRTHFICIYDDTLDTYNRSFDYRYGVWYKRVVMLTVYYNVFDQQLCVQLQSRIVDDMYVNRTASKVCQNLLCVRNISNQLEDLIRPHLRPEASLPVQTAIATIKNKIQQSLKYVQIMLHRVIEHYHIPLDLMEMILVYVY